MIPGGVRAYKKPTSGLTSVTVANYSFESPSISAGSFGGAPTSWSQNTNNIGVQNDGSPYPTGMDGVQCVYSNGGSLWQDVGALLASKTYTLTVAVAGTSYGDQNGGSSGSIALINGTDNTGTVLATLTITPTIGNANFSDYVITYTSGSSVSSDLVICLSLVTDQQIMFDNVRLTHN